METKLQSVEQDVIQYTSKDVPQSEDVRVVASTSSLVVRTHPTEPIGPHILSDLLAGEWHMRRREDGTGIAWGFAFSLVILSILHLIAGAWNTSVEGTLLWGIGVLCAMTVVMGTQMTYRVSRRRRKLKAALAQKQDIRSTGALLQVLRVPNTSIRNLAKRSLIDLLPQLQTKDGDQLAENERRILLRTLSISPNNREQRELSELFSKSAARAAYQREVDLRVAILKAYEQIGGSREESVVRRLAQGTPSIPTGRPVPEEIRKAASDCLPHIEARAALERAAAQLLRPTTHRDEIDASLLRAASATDASRSDELLHPTDFQTKPPEAVGTIVTLSPKV